jgi:hypothetical protein
MLTQQSPQPASESLAAFFANPGPFIEAAAAKAVAAALANWQPLSPATPAIDPDELHDVPASARFLGVVSQTIHTYAKEGILTPLRLRPGGKLYFKKSDLLAALTRSGASKHDGRRKAGRTSNKKA